MKKERFDVIVIGAGAGGVAAAIRASQLKAKVALIERSRLGGFCMNSACIPFTHMMWASHIRGFFVSLGKDMGIGFKADDMDISKLLRRQKDLIGFMQKGVEGILKKNQIELIKAKASLRSPKEVEINSSILEAEKLIIATGSRWLDPEFAPIDGKRIITSDHLLTGWKQKGRFLISGDNPFMPEVAQFLAATGSQVYLITSEDRLLKRESKSISSRITKVLKEAGINVYTRSEILSLKDSKNGLKIKINRKGKEESIEIDYLVYMKRKAMLNEIGLERLGLDLDRDYISVNERMETEIHGVYAVGDVSAPQHRHYSHLASSGGIVAAENAMGMKSAIDYRTLPRILYTSPQIACIGLTEKEAKEAGYDVITGTAPLSMNPYGMLLSQDYGLIEIVADKRYGEILGIHMIGEGVCEIAGYGVLAIQLEATLEELSKSILPHPSISESLAEAARACMSKPIYLP